MLSVAVHVVTPGLYRSVVQPCIAQGPLENVARAAYRSLTVKVLPFKENLFYVKPLRD